MNAHFAQVSLTPCTALASLHGHHLTVVYCQCLATVCVCALGSVD